MRRLRWSRVTARRPRPCIVCGVRVADGASRCQQHLTGGKRPRPCLVCARPSQGNYCPEHEPKVDEQLRNAKNPYRRAYKDQQYARNRQHRFERARGRCEICQVALIAGEWECDHVVTIKNGGTNDITNLRVLCKPCHRKKTRQDRKG